MKLLEIVRGKKSCHSVIATAFDVGKRIGKVPVLSENCYGFIGNRMLKCYAEEAVFMVEEGLLANILKISGLIKVNEYIL